MRVHPLARAAVAVAALLLWGPTRGQTRGLTPDLSPYLTPDLTPFWAAGSPAEAAKRVDDVVRSGAGFDDVYRQLREGRTYTARPGGIIRAKHVTPNGVEHHYILNVPDGYDPSRRYPARIHLHGGVMMRQSNVPPATAAGIGALAGDEPQIYIVPFSWDAAPWWTDDQLLNLREILDTVKRGYNVDENRVVVSGVSDGGTGAYYIAMRDSTAYAAFLPLNGFWAVLANRDLRIDSPLFPNNLRNKPFFIVNGERDPLYPTKVVTPAVEHYKGIGVTLEYLPQEGAGHNTQWWPRVKERFDGFARAHARAPLPDALTWETANTMAFNRAHWLVIDRLGKAPGEPALDDPNLVPAPPRLQFGVRSMGNRIQQVVPGSNAETIGLRAGDGIVRVNDEPARVRIDLEEVFSRLTPGDPIAILVARDNAPLELAGTYQPTQVVDPPAPLFDRDGSSGRVDLVRQGNTVTARTHGVTAFTLLISPEQFDFAKPITVVANGKTVFNRRVEKNVRTLMKWAAADNDRTMLFGAEIKITVPGT